MTLYHYTTSEHYQQIMKDWKMYPSGGFIPQVDCTYGEGWYMTDLGPNTCRAYTVAYCWGNITRDLFQKVQYSLEFEVAAGCFSLGRNHVYLVPETQWDGNFFNRINVNYVGAQQITRCQSWECFDCTKVMEAMRMVLA